MFTGTESAVTLLLCLSILLRYESYVKVCHDLKRSQVSTFLTRNSLAKDRVSNPSRPKADSKLVTDPSIACVRINGLRWITPGDYVVHKELGIGRFVGLRDVNLTPTLSDTIIEPTVVIRYLDGEVSWLQRFVEKELWLYRPNDGSTIAQSAIDTVELNSIVDLRKWKRRKIAAEENSRKMALNLMRLMAIRNAHHRVPYAPDDTKFKQFESKFRYTPTEDQMKCFQDIERDMVNSSRPMDRLVCGDVGFGKTEVAIRAIYRAASSGKQVAMLAPTRVLALQHYRVLSSRMPDVQIQLLRGGNKSEAVRSKESISNGTCQVVVGTHAILQSSVKFCNLGLVVIDEEQRFGVVQKEKLKSAMAGVDVLTLSATPIPRTLQMSLTGLRDLSLINSPPSNRKEVKVFVEKYDDAIVKRAVEQELARDGQVYVVVPFIKDMVDVLHRLKRLFPGVSIIAAHGQNSDLEDRIDYFASGQASILLSTTVIENGIDLPRVNTIIVLSAHRFGMSALYQLRGRVGRSDRQAYAFFLTNTSSLTVEADNRLAYLKTFTALGSGYDLSRRDMEMRGHGTIFGSEQSGSKDVGVDLQTMIMQQAVDSLKGQFILSVPDTSILIPSRLLSNGKLWNGEGLPSVRDADINTDTIRVARWENSVASNLIRKCFDSALKKASVNETMAMTSIEGAYAEYLKCSDYKDVLNLQRLWNKRIFNGKMPSLLEEMLLRTIVRILSRKLGIYLIEGANDGRIALRSATIDERKWRTITNGTAVDTLGSIEFRTVPSNQNNTEISVINVDVGHAITPDPASTSINICKTLIEFIGPLAIRAEKMLEEAIASCNIDDAGADEGG